jgi:hypothetical protein
MLLWEEEETAHDRAVRRVKSFLRRKHNIKFEEDRSIGARRRPDLSAHDEPKGVWYLCEVKDSSADLQRALDQFDQNRHFLKRKYRKLKVVCYLAITKELHDGISTSQVGALQDFQKRMKKNDIKILVVSRSTVRPV